jgi:hypothetical protein
MKAHPAATELLASVSRFLRYDVLPSLTGSLAFNLKVSLNALELVGREIQQQRDADQKEHGRLVKLLDRNAELETLRNELCDKVASGAITLNETALRDHLRATAIDRLAIDQPSYSAYLAAMATSGDGAGKKNPSGE